MVIRLPPGYEAGTQRDPVLYHADTEAQFGNTASTADILAVQGRNSSLIMVAIRNTDRARDLTPTTGSLVLAAHHDGRGASFANRMLPREPQSGFPRGAAEELATQSAKPSKTVGSTVVSAERMVNLAGRTAGSPNGRSRRRSRSSR